MNVLRDLASSHHILSVEMKNQTHYADELISWSAYIEKPVHLVMWCLHSVDFYVP